MFANLSAVPAVMTIVVAALAGCGFIDELAQRLDTSAAAAAPPAPRIKPERVVPPPPRPKPRIRHAAKAVDRPKAAPEFDAEKLIGLKPAQAIAALGNPTTVQERSPSMVWRYNEKGCALDLFFYMDLGANAFRVLAYEMKAASSTGRAQRACHRRFRAAMDGR